MTVNEEYFNQLDNFQKVQFLNEEKATLLKKIKHTESMLELMKHGLRMIDYMCENLASNELE